MKKQNSGTSGNNRRQEQEDEKNQVRMADSAVRNSMQEQLRMLEQPQDEPQKFLKNNKYFTICIYAFVLVVASTIMIRAIILPNQTRHFFAGLKISASYAVVGAVISEWLGGFNCLGVYMTRVKKAYAFDKMFAVIIFIVVISLLLMALVNLIGTVSMPWVQAAKREES